jgi:Zn-dependent protease
VVLAIAVGSWALLDPLRAATGSAEDLAPALAQAILAILYIGGLEGLLVNLLPIRYLDGAKVMRWNRAVWGTVYAVVLFLWWQLLFNRDAAYADAFKQTGVVVVFAMLGFFMATTGVVWTYFWRRDRREEAAGAASAADMAEAAFPEADIETE